MVKIVIPRLTCKKCGRTWIPRIEEPRMCPFCKRQDWENPAPVVKRKSPKKVKPSNESEK